MNPVDEIMYAANDVTLQIKRYTDAAVPDFSQLAGCLCAARQLRVRAARVALSLPAGEDRTFVMDIRAQALLGERKIRKALVGGSFALGGGT